MNATDIIESTTTALDLPTLSIWDLRKEIAFAESAHDLSAESYAWMASLYGELGKRYRNLAEKS